MMVVGCKIFIDIELRNEVRKGTKNYRTYPLKATDERDSHLVRHYRKSEISEFGAYPHVGKLLTNLHVTQMQLPSEMIR